MNGVKFEKLLMAQREGSKKIAPLSNFLIPLNMFFNFFSLIKINFQKKSFLEKKGLSNYILLILPKLNIK